MTDRHHLLPRHREPIPPQHEHHNAKRVHQAETQALKAGERIHISKLPGDPLALRGIPAIGRGVHGHITGTAPDQLPTLNQ